MFSIGEFSKITGLTVKTLRFYHEQGLLVPSCVDDETGYRYYDQSKVEWAAIVVFLRGLDFSLADIGEILRNEGDEAELLAVIERQRRIIEEKIGALKNVRRRLDQFIRDEKQAREIMATSSFEVEEKVVPPQLIAGVRMKGRYDQCGTGFSTIGKAFGRHISGKCFLLHYDTEYREDDADYEACMPIRKGTRVDGVAVRELPGGPAVCLLHKGPYEQLGRSYARILAYVKEKGYSIVEPTREVYLKGPGMIFKGNPKNYLTEIQMLVEQVGRIGGNAGSMLVR
ncbi:MAG: MerR family transcriptional regulator [Pirellulales bacterium]